MRNIVANFSFVAIACFAAAPLQAADCLERSWAGTLGKSKVTLEFRSVSDEEGENSLKGHYYYGNSWAELALQKETAGSADWQESDAKGKTTGKLTLECSGDTLKGRWTSPDGSKPLELQAAPVQEFNAQRRQAPRRDVVKTDSFQGQAFERLSASKAYELDAIQIKGTQAGVTAVNALIWQRYVGQLENAADCLTSGLLQRGPEHDFEYDDSSEIVEWNAAYVVIAHQGGGYCGGAHPFSGFGANTYNLASGTQEKVKTWLLAEYATEIPTESALSKQLRQIYTGAQPPDEHMRECLEAIEFGPESVWPRATGLAFAPYAPHAMTACASEEVILPYAQAKPFLSDYGKAQISHFLPK